MARPPLNSQNDRSDYYWQGDFDGLNNRKTPGVAIPKFARICSASYANFGMICDTSLI
jgi:hypothetical protein